MSETLRLDKQFLDCDDLRRIKHNGTAFAAKNTYLVDNCTRKRLVWSEKRSTGTLADAPPTVPEFLSWASE